MKLGRRESSMKVTRCQIVLIVVMALILVVSLSGCMVGKEKVAVIPLSGPIAGTSQQGLLTIGGITPDLVRDYLNSCLLYTSPSPRDRTRSRMPSSA